MRFLQLGVLVVLALAANNDSWSPTGGYAPGYVNCPVNASFLRDAKGLLPQETEWLKGRRPVADKALQLFLDNAGMEDFDAGKFLSNTTNGRQVKVGIAFSGGGYRAMLCGAGQMAALDNRTRGASDRGLGGLLQAATYLSGLSGGNWLVGTIVLNNYTSVQDILDQKNSGEGLWDLEHSIANFGGWNVAKTVRYYKSLYDDVEDKRDAGFDASFTDTWGRALLHQFFRKEIEYGRLLLWNSLQNMDEFTSHQMPFPIVISDGRTPGTEIISGNSTVFEINPFELGSWDQLLQLFTDVRWIGSTVLRGMPLNSLSCVNGFDNAGFILGTSLTLFNQFILRINTTSFASAIKDIFRKILNQVLRKDNDIASYRPNPFRDDGNATYKLIVQNNTLFLVDGGEDNQNVPLYPLIQRVRDVDVIFAYDNSADTGGNWPDGASLVATYQRQFMKQGAGTIFPHVPDVNSFRNLNLTSKPAFFGCDAKNLSSLAGNSSAGDIYKSPLIVYTANRPFTYYSNRSTFKLSYSQDEKVGMIKNGFEVASRLNRTLDSSWPACVGCAIIRREQERQGIEQSDQCKQCFQKYCWDGSLDDSTANINFTTTGTTNGSEETGNRTVSGAISLIGATAGYNMLRALGYAALVLIACSFSV